MVSVTKVDTFYCSYCLQDITLFTCFRSVCRSIFIGDDCWARFLKCRLKSAEDIFRRLASAQLLYNFRLKSTYFSNVFFLNFWLLYGILVATMLFLTSFLATIGDHKGLLINYVTQPLQLSIHKWLLWGIEAFKHARKRS